MKRLCVKLLGILIVSTALISGCSSNQSKTDDSKNNITEVETSVKEDKKDVNETIEFTDDLGRTVTVPKEIKRIVPGGYPAQSAIYSVAAEKIVGWAGKPNDSAKKYMDSKLAELPEFGSAFAGAKGNFNAEALIETKPDIIVDMGSIEGDMVGRLDDTQKQVGIPMVYIEMNFDDMDKGIKKLGELLGTKENTDKQAKYIGETLDRCKETNEKITDENRVSVYIAGNENGLLTHPKGSYPATVIERAGAKNVADLDGLKAPKVDVSLEQITEWGPDVILTSDKTFYENVFTDPNWMNIKAVQEKKVYFIPNEPYSFMAPPSVNGIIGLNWVGNLLYPDIYKLDMNKEIKDFYKTFYHYDLTDSEAEELLKDSMVK